MIYFYEIIIHYNIGNSYIEKTYKKSFNEIIDFLIYLKQKHKDNFTIYSILPKKKI